MVDFGHFGTFPLVTTLGGRVSVISGGIARRRGDSTVTVPVLSRAGRIGGKWNLFRGESPLKSPLKKWGQLLHRNHPQIQSNMQKTGPKDTNMARRSKDMG